MMTTTNPPAEAAEGIGAFALVSGKYWGVRLPNGLLYRHPGEDQPALFEHEIEAQTCAAVVLSALENTYGIDTGHPANDVRVVPLELGSDGQWRLPAPDRRSRAYRPIDPDTGLPSLWPCAAMGAADLTVAEARAIMREHRECAGLMPCTIRGRARALLARAGVMKLRRGAHAFDALDLPEVA